MLRSFDKLEFKLIYENAIEDESLLTILTVYYEDVEKKFADYIDHRILSEIFKVVPKAIDITDISEIEHTGIIYGPSVYEMDYENFIGVDSLERYDMFIVIKDVSGFMRANIINKSDNMIHVGLEINRPDDVLIYRMV